MRVALDHAVLFVPDLDVAVGDFRAAGFTVVPGGRHDVIPTVNALIAFADGSYLELLAPRDEEARESLRVRAARRGWAAEVRRSPAIARRFLPGLVGPPGVGDYVLRCDDLRRIACELRRLDLAATGPVPMSRQRADGVRLDWELLLPDAPWLPFFIADRTDRALRVPSDPVVTTHANGARGVTEIRVRVDAIAPVALAYGDLFRTTPRVRGDGATELDVGDVHVVIEQGMPAGARGAVVSGAGTLGKTVTSLGVSARRD